MTEAELYALIKAEALKTTIPPTEFLARVKSGGYDFRQAHWFKVMQAAEQLKYLPASDAYLEPARNVCFFATVTDEAVAGFCALPKRWKAAFTADPAYPVKDSHIAAVKDTGHQAWAWGDCHSTMPVAIRTFMANRGLHDWYGEAESEAAFDVAYAAGAPVVIGNLSALRDDQLALVIQAKELFIEENYRNVRPEVAPDWRNANKGIGGNAGAVYGSASEDAVYTSAASQIRHGWFGVHDSWYCEGFLPADWAALKALG